MELYVDLKEKSVIVTAAGGAIGSACALALAKCGASLTLNDIDEEALTQTESQVREMGCRVISIPGDVSDYDRVQEMGATAINQYGDIFGLVNIAGASTPKRIIDLSIDEWRHIWNVNVSSLFNWIHAVGPNMLASEHGGRIINNSSLSGKQGGDENSISCAAYPLPRPAYWVSLAGWLVNWLQKLPEMQFARAWSSTPAPKSCWTKNQKLCSDIWQVGLGWVQTSPRLSSISWPPIG